METVEVPYKHGYDFGIGTRLVTGSPMQLGVTGTISPVQVGPGGSGSFSLTEVTSTKDLETALGISAEASGSVGLFSASARFDFARQAKVTETSILLLIHATRTLGFEQIDKPSLDADAAALVNAQKIELFDQCYGDSFVRGMLTGGQFFGLVRIETTSSYDKSEIKAKLKGAYGTFKLDSSADFTKTVSSSSSSINTYLYWEGGIVNILPHTPEELIAAAREWRDSVDNLPVPYQVTLAPYAVANGPIPLNSAVLQHQRDVLAVYAGLRSRTMDALNLVEYMMAPEHAGEFIPNPQGTSVDLAALNAGLSNDLDMIASAASYAIENPTEAKNLEDYARDIKHINNYVLTSLPLNMPLHEGIIKVPNFVGLEYLIKFLRHDPPPPNVDVGPCVYEWGTGKHLMSMYEHRLQFNLASNGINEAPSHIVAQSLDAGMLVKAGSTITLTITINGLAHGKCMGF